MQLLALFWLLLAQFGQMSVGGPTQVQNPDYPLRIRILERSVQRNGYYGYAHMWGRADVVEPRQQGFDFDSQCGELFMVTHGAEAYSGRWKKTDHEIEMLISRMGTDKANKCTLKVDMKQYVYVIERGAIITKPLPK